MACANLLQHHRLRLRDEEIFPPLIFGQGKGATSGRSRIDCAESKSGRKKVIGRGGGHLPFKVTLYQRHRSPDARKVSNNP